MDLGAGQHILEARQVYLVCADGVVRAGVAAWLADVDTGEEVFLALEASNSPPTLRSPRPTELAEEPSTAAGPSMSRVACSNKAWSEDAEVGDWILLDSGANRSCSTRFSSP